MYNKFGKLLGVGVQVGKWIPVLAYKIYADFPDYDAVIEDSVSPIVADVKNTSLEAYAEDNSTEQLIVGACDEVSVGRELTCNNRKLLWTFFQCKEILSFKELFLFVVLLP
ncbi:hypothetical protein ACJJTC_017428 [Scirpophaga incertulas]